MCHRGAFRKDINEKCVYLNLKMKKRMIIKKEINLIKEFIKKMYYTYGKEFNKKDD